MVVSGEQPRDSAMYIDVSILPQTPLPPKLPYNIEQSSLYYTVGPGWLPILYAALYTHPKLPNSPFPFPFLPGNRKFIL